MGERQGSGTATRANGSNGVATVWDLESRAEPTNGATIRKKKRPSRTSVVIGAVVVLLVLIAGGGAYFVTANRNVTADNAQVDGDQIQINAPATGTVTGWKATKGSQVRRGQPVGRIQLQGSGAQPQKIVRSPDDGTIAANPTVEGQWASAGTHLATAYNGNGIYATARVDETDVQNVHPGAVVDIDVDAFPTTKVTGVVTQMRGP